MLVSMDSFLSSDEIYNEGACRNAGKCHFFTSVIIQTLLTVQSANVTEMSTEVTCSYSVRRTLPNGSLMMVAVVVVVVFAIHHDMSMR